MKSFGRSFADTFTNTFPSSFQLGVRTGQEERQQSLLMAIKEAEDQRRAEIEQMRFQRQLEKDEFDKQYKQGQLISSFGNNNTVRPSTDFVPGKNATQTAPSNSFNVSALPGYTITPKPEKPEKPPKIVERNVNRNGRVETYFTREDEVPSGKPFATSPQWEPNSGNGSKDIYKDNLANIKLHISNIENYKNAEMSEDGSSVFPAGSEKSMSKKDYEQKYIIPEKNKAKLYGEKLIRDSGLIKAVKLIKKYKTQGYDLNTSLKMFKEDNPDISSDDEEILASYFYVDEL